MSQQLFVKLNSYIDQDRGKFVAPKEVPMTSDVMSTFADRDGALDIRVCVNGICRRLPGQMYMRGKDRFRLVVELFDPYPESTAQDVVAERDRFLDQEIGL